MELDIRVRLFLAAVLSLLAVIWQNPVVLLQLLGLSIIILFILRVPLTGLSRRIIKLWSVVMVLLFVGSIFQPAGSVLVAFKGISIITTGGLAYGFAVALRLAVITCSGLLFFSSGIRDLVPVLSKARIPYEIVFMVQVACRFLPLFAQEISDTLNALQLRGVDLKKVHLRKSVKILSFILGPLLYTIWWRARELAMVMEARGFRAYPTRTCYRDVIMKPVDYLALAVFSIVIALWAAINI